MIRTGGSLPQNVNFAIKGQLIHDFLRTNGFNVSSAEPRTNSFEKLQESVALVRSGIIPPGEENLPELVCAFSYVSLWDMWYRFRAFEIRFFDLKSGKLLVKAGQYRDTVFTNEDAVLDRTFKEVESHFFPGRVASAK